MINPLKSTADADLLRDIRTNYVPLVTLDRCAMQAVSKNIQLHPIDVVHEYYYLDSSVVYREGMEEIYCIESEWKQESRIL